ncbi:MAG: phosphate signaling complex protein PhoU [Endomicrobium sp.]|jgi:phosphate transport system protein|nr:phosphate signaling complex protein PhoU [Endomicrobium sp.]
MFQEKILLLKKGITDYADFAEKMLEKSLKALSDRNERLLHDIIDKDEPIANRREIEFDEICINYIAQYQPVTKNLRMIISAIKINNDLERMADHAVNIAQNALFIVSRPFMAQLGDILKMGSIAADMFKDSIKSFVDEDMSMWKTILEKENEVDSLKIVVTDAISAYIEKNPKNVSCALKMINIAANLERIADLTTNICEDAIYLSEGGVVKHKNASQP